MIFKFHFCSNSGFIHGGICMLSAILYHYLFWGFLSFKSCHFFGFELLFNFTHFLEQKWIRFDNLIYFILKLLNKIISTFFTYSLNSIYWLWTHFLYFVLCEKWRLDRFNYVIWKVLLAIWDNNICPRWTSRLSHLILLNLIFFDLIFLLLIFIFKRTII